MWRQIKCYMDDCCRDDIIKECYDLKNSMIRSISEDIIRTIKELDTYIQRDMGCTSGLNVPISMENFKCLGCDRYTRILDTDCTGRIVGEHIKEKTFDVSPFATLAGNKILMDYFRGSAIINWIIEKECKDRSINFFLPIVYSAYICNLGGIKIMENIKEKPDISNPTQIIKQIVDVCKVFEDTGFSMYDCDVMVSRIDDNEVLVLHNIINPSMNVSGYRIVAQSPMSRIMPPSSEKIKWSDKGYKTTKKHLERTTAKGNYIHSSINFI